MCTWERFCSFAREPERRTVGIDCRLTVAGVTYELDPELAGETVVVWLPSWAMNSLVRSYPLVDPFPSTDIASTVRAAGNIVRTK